MKIVDKSVMLTNDPPAFAGLDFAALRSEGIGYLQQLAGDTWTDHNLHDPGITILDQLCYGLTDLSYRISMDMHDLLARPDGKTYSSLFSPATILTTNPVTLNDFRKVLLDIAGVKNAWIEKVTNPQPPVYFDPHDNTLSLQHEKKYARDDTPVQFEQISIKGLYRVFVARANANVSVDGLTKLVRARLHECRNLCEDFDPLMIGIMDEQKVILTADIEVGNASDANLLAANILYRIGKWLSPAINFYTLQQMLAKGKTIDEIMDGPALAHGFIDDDELNAFARRPKLYGSDLIREIMAEPEVRVVNNLTMKTGSGPENDWVLDLDINYVTALNERACLDNGFRFQKNGQVLTIHTEAVLDYLAILRTTEVFPVLPKSARDIVPQNRQVRNIGLYYSIQNHFPQVYGIGDIGLPDSAPAERKAQAKQLKAYLLFFEQIMANYFEQAAGLKNLFAFDNEDIGTYFHQSLIDQIPDIDGLLAENYVKNIAALTEDTETALERKDRFLNHLLARFGENLTDYSLWLNDRFSSDTGDVAMIAAADPMENEKSRLISYKRKLIGDKLNFLSNYPAMSNERGKGFNYTRPGWDNDNVSGLEKRIAGKLGVANYTRCSLVRNQDSFHMIEHILLRPRTADKELIDTFINPVYFTGFQKDKDGHTICISPGHGLQNGEVILIKGEDKDKEYTVSEVLVKSFQIVSAYDEKTIAGRRANKQPALSWVRRDIDSTIFKFYGEVQPGASHNPYSFQLTFVFNDNNKKYANPNFRKFIETTIREETPAHLTVYIRWLKGDDLTRFEDALKVFLDQLYDLYKI